MMAPVTLIMRVTRAVPAAFFVEAQVALESSAAVAQESGGSAAKGEMNQLRWSRVAASLGGI